MTNSDTIKYTGDNYSAIGDFLSRHTDATAAEIEELLDVLHEEGWGLDEEKKPITAEGAQKIVAWLREKKSIIADEQARQ